MATECAIITSNKQQPYPIETNLLIGMPAEKWKHKKTVDYNSGEKFLDYYYLFNGLFRIFRFMQI